MILPGLFTSCMSYVPKVAQKDRLGHKIKLKKRLSKALATAGESTNITRTNKHQDHRPNPLHAAQLKQKKEEDAKRLAQEQREKEIQDRRRAAAQAREARRRERQKVTKRTVKGQPLMSGQIEKLLGKIQKTLK